MSKHMTAGKTAQTEMGPRTHSTTADAAQDVAEEGDAWEMLAAAYPDAITAIAEYAFMYGICIPRLFKDGDRLEARCMASIISNACSKADGNAPLSLANCWKWEPILFANGSFPCDLIGGLGYLRQHTPASFALLGRMDAMLPEGLEFPECPRMFSPAALVRFALAAVRDQTADLAA